MSKIKWVNNKYLIKLKEAEKWKKLLVASLFIVIVIVGVLYSQFSNSIENRYYKLNSTKISKNEYDFYYNTNYLNFIKNNKNNLKNINLNLSKDLSEQKSIDGINSWRAYFQKEAINFNKEIYSINLLARQNGFSKNRDELFKDYINSIENDAKNSNDTFEKILRDRHGKNATLEKIKKPLKDYLFANAYIDNIKKNKHFTNNEYEEFYKKNKDSLDKIDYRSFATEDENIANNIYENSKDETSYNEEVLKNAPKEELELFKKENSTKLIGAKRDNMDKNVASWLYDKNRKTGDMAVIKSEDGKHFEVLYFIHRYRDNTSGINLKIIFLDKNNEDLANSIYNKVKNGNEKTFNEEVFKNTIIKKDKETNGYYKNFPKGYLTDEFDTWAFDSKRKNGDIIKLKYENGFIIARFQDKNKKESWKINAESNMLNIYISETVKNEIKKVKFNDVNNIFLFK